MNFFFDANKYGSIFTKKVMKKPELAESWLATWRDMDHHVRHDLLYKATTNNEAEYGSCIMVLNHILDNANIIKEYTNEVLVYGDSQLVVNQISGEYKVREENLKPLWLEAVNLIHVLEKEHGITVRVRWIPREVNNESLGITKRLSEGHPTNI
jgi:ribonuclease HI